MFVENKLKELLFPLLLMGDDWRMIITLGCAKYWWKRKKQSPMDLGVQCWFNPYSSSEVKTLSDILP